MGDRKFVATKQGKGSELRYIAKTYKIPMKVIRSVIKELSIDESDLHSQEPKDLEVSRDKIYAALRLKGFTINVQPMTKKGKAAFKRVNVDPPVEPFNLVKDNPY